MENQEKKMLTVSASPHVRSNETTTGIMFDVIIATIPAIVMSVVYFGVRALILTATTVITCMLSEYISRKVMKRHSTIGDLSAIVTGILLAFNLPVTIPLWIAMIGSVVAIVVVKQMFGGIGQNFVNPALVTRIILMVSFPTAMARWIIPFENSFSADAVTKATPMASIAGVDASTFKANSEGFYSLFDLFVGKHGGSMGEVCVAALVCGGLYLIFRRVISPIIPLTFVGTVAIFMFIVSGGNFDFVAYHLLSGGLMLGAIFMATDYTTSPINFKGKIVFAIGCGLITSIIRYYGALPEGVSFAIIIMNILVPHIENLTRAKAFGQEDKKKVKEVA